MLASVNLNYDVYVEPNERTFELYAEHYAPDRKEEYIQNLKDRVIYAEVRGQLKPLLKFQIFQFLEIFGEEMEPFTTNTAFEHNQAFFELNQLCPAFSEEPTLPSPTALLLPPHAHMVIDTGCPDTSTVRVKYDDYDHDIFTYWGLPTSPATTDYLEVAYLDEQIIDGTQDHIVRCGHTAIHLVNKSDKEQTCSISYARFVK